MDNQRYNLLYKPNLEPERNYRSEATFIPKEIPPVVDTDVPITPDLPQIIEDLKELEELAPGLPTGLEPIGEIVTVLRQRAEIIQIEQELIEGITPPPTVGPPTGTILTVDDIPPEIKIGTNVSPPPPVDEEEQGVTIEENTFETPELPEMFPPPTNITINVETPKTLVEMAQEAYAKDQIDLQKYYLQSMRLALQKYFQNQLALATELGLSDVSLLTRDYDGESVKGISVNSQHLHDTIIRSQLARKQKARYFSKMANTDQTLVHMRNWNASEKLRERYYSEAYGDSEKFIDSEANAILRQNRSEYDANYKANLYNMYKYLDGAVKMTEDILDHVSIESKAKAKLLKDGVNIYAQPEVTSANAGEGVSTTQAQYSDELKAKEKSNTNTETSKPTAEDIDQANKVTDPADEKVWGLAPNGGHWSKNDIDYLISVNPEVYGTSGQKMENVKLTLAQHVKYASNETSTQKTNSATINSTSTTQSSQISSTSNNKVEQIVNLTTNGIITGATTKTIEEQEADKAREEVKNESAAYNFVPDPYYVDYLNESSSTKKSNIIEGSGFVCIMSKTGKNSATMRIVNAETSAVLASFRRTSSDQVDLEKSWQQFITSGRANSVSFNKTLNKDDYLKALNKFASIPLIAN